MVRIASVTICLLSMGTALAAVPTTKTVVNQPGRFQLTLPKSFRVLKHGRIPGKPGYQMIAQSAKGNVKVYAAAVEHRDPTVDLAKHLALWLQTVKTRGLYSDLRPIGKPQRNHAMLTQMFSARGRRVKSLQPYTIYVGISLDRKAQRLYTLSLAAQTPAFARHRQRILDLAKGFRPFIAKAVPKKLAKRTVRRISLKGKLVKRPDGLILGKKR